MVEAGRILREELAKGESIDGPDPVRFADVQVADSRDQRGGERPPSLNLPPTQPE